MGDGESASVTADFIVAQVPARASFVSALRCLAIAVGAVHELTVDDIEDLQIAVDEACALVLPLAVDDPLEARFKLHSGHLAVTVCVPANPDADVDHDGLAWTVLSAVSGELEASVDNGCATVRFTKTRGY